MQTAPIPYTATFDDGTTERIIISKPTISKLYDWLYLGKDQKEPAMVALAVNRDVAWVDNLEPDSYALLAQKADELIFPMAVRLAKMGAPVAAALIAPLLQRRLLGLQIAMALSHGSGASSPTPPPSESVPVTPAESPTAIPSTPSVTSSPSATA